MASKKKNVKISLVKGGKNVTENGKTTFVPGKSASKTSSSSSGSSNNSSNSSSSYSSQLESLKQRALEIQRQIPNATGYDAPMAPKIAPVTPQEYKPYKPEKSNVDQYYQDLLKSMQPTSEETALQGQSTALDTELSNLNQGQGVMNRNIKDQPIALGFITGQQNAVEERYGLQRRDVMNRQQTLQQKLANLQQKRQASIDVAKVGVDYGQSQDSRNDNIAQQNYQNQFQQTQFNANQTQQQYANTTGASRYVDTQAQQQIENQIAQQNANRLATPSEPKPTEGDKLREQVVIGSAWLGARTGADGYVSPADYQKAKRDWVAAGNSSESFDKQFSVYINPQYRSSYTGEFSL